MYRWALLQTQGISPAVIQQKESERESENLNFKNEFKCQQLIRIVNMSTKLEKKWGSTLGKSWNNQNKPNTMNPKWGRLHNCRAAPLREHFTSHRLLWAFSDALWAAPTSSPHYQGPLDLPWPMKYEQQKQLPVVSIGLQTMAGFCWHSGSFTSALRWGGQHEGLLPQLGFWKENTKVTPIHDTAAAIVHKYR